MKKAASFALACLLAVTTLVSCGQTNSAPMGFKEISDEGVTYHLYVPDEWTTDISTGMTSAYYDGRDPSSVSVTAFELDGSVTSIDDYWTSYEADFKAVFPDYTLVSSDDALLGGTVAKEYVYTGTLSGTAYQFMQLVSFRKNQVYIFTYTASADKYESHLEDVAAILEYFAYKD